MRAFVSVILLVISLSICRPALAEPGLLAPGTPAPNFIADGISGGSLRLSDFRGRIVVLTFFATWCGPCNRAMPSLQAVYNRYRNDNVVVLCLCSWDTAKDLDTWMRSHQYTMTFAMDPAEEDSKQAISNSYEVTGVPTTFIIDQNGIVRDAGVVMGPYDVVDDLASLGVGSGPGKARRSSETPVNREVGRMDRTVVAITGPLEIKGLLSSKPVDPYAGLSESAGAAKANALIQKARYETAADVVRSMDKRHETKLLGPVYNALGDHAMTANQLDSAWGWYLMTVRNSIDPADLAHAHFGLAGYFTATGDSAKAADEYRAVLALPGVTDADKTRAQGLLDKSKS